MGLASLCFPGVRDLGVHGGGEPGELAGDSRGRRGGADRCPAAARGPDVAPPSPDPCASPAEPGSRCAPSPSHSCSRGRRQAAAGVGTRGERGAPAGPSGNMATGGYRSGGSTTDFLEEWKAKREKMRAKQNPAGPGSGSGGGEPAAKSPAGLSPTAVAGTSELNHGPAGAAAPAVPGPTTLNCALGPSALPRSAPGSRRPEEECSTAAAVAGAPASRGDEEEPDGAPEKGRSSGPSARKGKGQIEKRKLREKRRSTGVVNIPAAEVSRTGRGGASSGIRAASGVFHQGAPSTRGPEVPCTRFQPGWSFTLRK